jgi:hypothetical protein
LVWRSNEEHSKWYTGLFASVLVAVNSIMVIADMKSQQIRLFISIAIYIFGSSVYAANGGMGNCRGNGNIQHGCASSVTTPNILTGTSQANPKQPTGPIPTANQLPPQQVPPQIPQQVPMAVPPQVPMAVPPLVPQQVPMAVPPQIPQQVPVLIPPQVTMAVPPQIPQQVPMAVPPQVPMAVPPLVPQQVPMAVPPQIPQQVPVLIPPQVTMAVPPQIPQQVPMAVPPQVVMVAPPLVHQQTPVPMVIIAPKETAVTTAANPMPIVEITDKGNSASYNQNMIANIPGRQSPASYAVFKNETTGSYRECVVSGLERRKIISPSGEVSYLGALPSFRTVSTEVADIPSWHPHEAGCIVSLQHNVKLK